MSDTPLHLLTSLGLNQLEAEVYMALLSHEPMTAYRIGRLLDKPTANVYKAIDALSRKGAVLVEEGKNRVCRAVPAAEFMRHLEQDVHQKTRQAARLLETLRTDTYDERMYQLQSAGQVLERARHMLAGCRTIAVLDVFPRPLARIREAVLEAVARGVAVYVQVYEPADLPGAHVVLPRLSGQALQVWQSQQLNLVIDGKEHLISLLDQHLQQVHQATWSRNLYLSCMLHAGFMREHALQQIINLDDGRQLPPAVLQILHSQKFFFNTEIPGFSELFARYMAPAPEAGRPADLS